MSPFEDPERGKTFSAASPPKVSLAEQIRCAGRELGMRRATYPKFVQSGRMKQDEADREIERMAAIYETLKGLQTSQEEGR